MGDLLAASRDLRSFDKEDAESDAGKARAQKLVKDYFADYAQNAAVAPDETDMFGTPPPTREEMMRHFRENGRDAGPRFSVNPNLRADIDAALNTDPAKGTVVKGGKRVVFGRSQRLFPALGLPDGDIYSKAYALRKIANDHNLTAEQLAAAPSLMEEPAAVFDDNGNGYVFLTDAIASDEDGKDAPVMFYIRPDGEGNYIASAYARKERAESKYVNLVNAGMVRYWDKSKIARLPLRGEAQSSLITFSAGDSVVTPEGLTPQSVSQTGAPAQGARYSIAGRGGAANLGLKGAAEAEAMEKAGSDREDIWRTTGWWRGRDGKWRVEIPDVKRKRWDGDPEERHFMGGGEDFYRYRLTELIEDGDFLKAYPKARDIVVEFHKNMPANVGGNFNDATLTIKMPQKFHLATDWAKEGLGDGKSAELNEAGRKTIVHELQHAIQLFEGFAKGGSPTEPVRPYALDGETGHALSVFGEAVGLDPTNDRHLLNIANWAQKITSDYTKGDVPQRIVESFEAAAKEAGKTPQEFRDEIERLYDSHTETPLGQYIRLEGEVEARNVKERLNMTPEARAAIPPWKTEDVAEASQIVRYSVAAPLVEAMRNRQRYSVAGIYTGTAADYANRSRQGGVDDGPSVKHIGTGEGSQVYGWGLYGSTVRGVAEGYARPNHLTPEGLASSTLHQYSNDRDAAIAHLQKYVDSGRLSFRALTKEEIARTKGAIEILKSHAEKSGYLYEQTFFTDRAPGDESHLLKWYEPVSGEQKEWIERGLQTTDLGLPGGARNSARAAAKLMSEVLSPKSSISGGELYQAISDALGSPQAASEFLYRAGIDGVKYPVDSYGKTVKDGDKAGWNYVAFSDEHIRVDHKWTDGQMRYSISVTPEMRRETTVNAAEATLEKTKAALAALAGKPLINDETKIEAWINDVQARKIVSNKAVAKSEANGFTKAEHNAAAAIIETLWKYATLGKSAPDRDGDPNIRSVKRFVSPVFFRNGEGRKDAYAYITAKESVEHGHRIYSIEIEKLEALGKRLDRSQALLPNAPSVVPEGTPESVSQTGGRAQGGGFRASTGGIQEQTPYPNLAMMSDDEVLVAALAVRIAGMKHPEAEIRGGAGRRTTYAFLRISTVKKYLQRIHPGMSDDKLASLVDSTARKARKLALRMREDLARGVSESAIVRNLPENMRDTFGEEMKAQAGRGSRFGRFGAKAEAALANRQAEILAQAVKVQTGLEFDEMENAYGIDLSLTLQSLAENTFAKPPSRGAADGAAAAAQPADETVYEDGDSAAAREPAEVSGAVKSAVDEIVSATGEQAEKDLAERKKRRKAAEKKKRGDESSGTGAGSVSGAEAADASGGDEAADPVATAVRKAKIDLQNPRHLALFVVELARRRWNATHNLAKDADPWGDAIAMQFLRKTAQSVYSKLAKDLCYSGTREHTMKTIDAFGNIPTVERLVSEMEYTGALVNARRISETAFEMCKKLKRMLETGFGATGRFRPDNEELRRRVPAEMELRARYMKAGTRVMSERTAMQNEFRNAVESICHANFGKVMSMMTAEDKAFVPDAGTVAVLTLVAAQYLAVLASEVSNKTA